MTDVIEILFENIDFKELQKFLKDLGSKSKLRNIQLSSDNNIFLMDEFNSILNLTKTLSKHSDGAVYINFKIFDIGEYSLPEVGVQILKYDNTFDLSIDIQYKHLRSHRSLEHIRDWSADISEKLGAKSYCCGLEPASDEATRFFTNNTLGPLKFTTKTL